MKGGNSLVRLAACALLSVSLLIVPTLYATSFFTLARFRSHKVDGITHGAAAADQQQQRSLAGGEAPTRAQALESLCRGLGRAPSMATTTSSSGNGLSPSVPLLWDVGAMPSINATCPHCKSHDDILFCCGVCVFEHRFCEQKKPGKAVSQRVLKELLGRGVPLGDLTPCELFQRIRGRTLWFMGDSQTWHFYLAVECFLHPFAVDYRRRNVTDEPEKRLLLRPVTVTKERYSLCLHLLGHTRVCVIRADDAWVMARDIFPTLRTLGDLTQDIMVYNFGLHWPPTEEVMGAQLAHIAEYVQANRTWMPHMIWMDTPPQHFKSDSGMYNPQAMRKGCPPLPNNTIVQEGGMYNAMNRQYVSRLGEAHLQTWDATVPFFYAHLNPDCTHFCSPGPYQYWTFLLNQLLRERRLGNTLPGDGEGGGGGSWEGSGGGDGRRGDDGGGGAGTDSSAESNGDDANSTATEQ